MFSRRLSSPQFNVLDRCNWRMLQGLFQVDPSQIFEIRLRASGSRGFNLIFCSVGRGYGGNRELRFSVGFGYSHIHYQILEFSTDSGFPPSPIALQYLILFFFFLVKLLFL